MNQTLLQYDAALRRARHAVLGHEVCNMQSKALGKIMIRADRIDPLGAPPRSVLARWVFSVLLHSRVRRPRRSATPQPAPSSHPTRPLRPQGNLRRRQLPMSFGMRRRVAGFDESNLASIRRRFVAGTACGARTRSTQHEIEGSRKNHDPCRPNRPVGCPAALGFGAVGVFGPLAFLSQGTMSIGRTAEPAPSSHPTRASSASRESPSSPAADVVWSAAAGRIVVSHLVTVFSRFGNAATFPPWTTLPCAPDSP